MFFDSSIYLLFLGVVVVIYWRLDFQKQNYFLLVSSYVFYGWWDYRFLFLMAGSTCINYYIARSLEAERPKFSRKKLFIVALVINFSFLGFFKYFNFFIDSLVDGLASIGIQSVSRHWIEVLLPPGISFYTFQEVAYVADVYRRQISAARKIVEYALFVSVFPHLIAGPIQRPNHLLPQVQSTRCYSSESFFDGIMLILEGAFRKLVIADNCALVADAAFSGKLGEPNAVVVMLGGMGFACQIYGDFSGYSSIARGSAQLLGLHFMINFRQPYFATSLQEFWRRWHISLSTWLRDYLYIPLGGSRRGEVRTYCNLLVTMVLGGLWHGANWTFVIWGMIHGVGLAAERLIGSRSTASPEGSRSAIVAWLQRGVIFGVVGFSWIFFRAGSVAEALTFLGGMSQWQWQPEYGVACKFLGFFLLLSILIDLRIEHHREEYIFQKAMISRRVYTGLALVFLTFLFGANQSNAFIYFQF